MELVTYASGGDPSLVGLVRLNTEVGVGRSLSQVLPCDESDSGFCLLPLCKLEAILVKAAVRGPNLLGPIPFGFCHLRVLTLQRFQSYLTAEGFSWEPSQSVDHLAARVALFSQLSSASSSREVNDRDFQWVTVPEATNTSDDEETDPLFAALEKEAPDCLTTHVRFMFSVVHDVLDVAEFSQFGPFQSLYSKLAAWAGPRYTAADRSRGLSAMARALLQRASRSEMYVESKSAVDADRVPALLSAAADLECPSKCSSVSLPLVQDIRFRALASSTASGDVEHALASAWSRMRAFFPCLSDLLKGAEDITVNGHMRALTAILGLPEESISLVSYELVEARLADSTLLAHLNSLPASSSAAARVHALRSALSAGEARIAVASAPSNAGGSSSGSGSCSALARAHAEALNLVLLSPQVSNVLASIVDASSHMQVINLVLAARSTPLFQLLFTSGRVASSVPAFQSILEARQALPLYIGAAVSSRDSGPTIVGNARFIADPALFEIFGKHGVAAFLATNWHNLLVSRPLAAETGSKASTAALSMREAVLDSKSRLRLSTALRKFFCSLGFTGNGLAELIDAIDQLQAHLPDDVDTAEPILQLFEAGSRDIAEALSTVMTTSPEKELTMALWAKNAPSRLLQIELYDASEELNRSRRAGFHYLAPPSSSTPNGSGRAPLQSKPTKLPPAGPLKFLGTKPATISGDTLTYGATSLKISKIQKQFPATKGRCLAVVASFSESDATRLKYCTHSHDPAHQCTNTGVHAPVPGLTGIGHRAGMQLDFQ
jgi:hypothetical protein